ncbi:CD48 protein, partial [Odontophorus gujanensis]|nr:CD48 protein [Odontophorus gujanensis]
LTQHASIWFPDLLLLSLRSSLGVEVTERKLAAEGSSVMMHAPTISNVNITEWEYIEGTTPKVILQYYANLQDPVIYSAYEGRVVFYQTNGSLLLQQLRKADSGVYKATVDLMEDKARTTILEVIEPVPQPKLLNSLDLDGFLIKLTCLLPNGTTAAVSWNKDGHPLPPRNLLPFFNNQLLHDPTMLWIRKGEKSDCGSYSCNVSNAVSWKEATFNLTEAGLLPPFHAALKITVVALVLAVIAAVSFVIWLLQPGKHRLGKEVWAWLTRSITGLLGISCLLLFVTSVIWMQEEGPSAAFILHGLCFLAAVITMVLMAQLLTLLTVSLAERGCSEPVDVIASCILAVLVALLLLLFSFWLPWGLMAHQRLSLVFLQVKEGRDQNRDKESKLSLQHPGDDVAQELR